MPTQKMLSQTDMISYVLGCFAYVFCAYTVTGLSVVGEINLDLYDCLSRDV